ncbi:type VI secretion system protein TssA [Pseudomonas sp. SCB32]|uniref:type VI secretion system protein TssA n=1 Tax=Pseudomonas sp. SCB32 TaxID=2653853 RepID=UPI001265833F|nr:type VI secretion system protein TssA [Pseudomonas sp. SCB32]
MSLKGLISTCLEGQDAVALAQTQATAWDPWLAAISADALAGEDPGYDDDFQFMREEVNKLSGADVERVIGLAEQLLKQRCKDLRIATYYLWARTQRDGEAGLADGLELLAALLERFGEQVLPERPNSRRMALEWVASGKVLDSLSLFPEVVKAEAQRTVAALAWLEQIFSSWPEINRPALGSLYSALAARLTQSGGVNALVPQNSAAHTEPTPHSAAPVLSAIKSGRDLLDSGKALASYLRDQPQGWLAAHRLLTSLRWDTVHQSPPQEANGHTRLVPPRTEYRAQLKRLYLQQSWTELLDQVERMYAEGVNHFWLDLQWYLCQSLSKLGVPYEGWADIIKRDLGMFLERLPGIEQLRWSDGTPFADEPTREWIIQQVSGNKPAQWMSTAVTTTAVVDDVLALESEALAQADSDGVEAALAWLAARPDATTGRQRWLLRLLMARVAEQYGKSDLAIHLLSELDAVAQQQGLSAWEPGLGFEVKARLLKLLRQKSQRSDADKTTLARRMEGLLAALVAIDPVRSAVLCG